MEVTMPQLGETVTEGTVTRWLKAVGERVEADELLFEVSTDKVDSEVPSPVAGYLSEIVVPEGETVPVGARLAVLADAPPAEGAPVGDGPAPATEGATPVGNGRAQAPLEPVALSPAPAAPPPEPTTPPAPPAEAGEAPPSAGSPSPAPVRGLLLSPLVRRLLEEHRLDPAAIQGTGEGGRITRADVLALVEGGGRADGAPRAAPQPSAVPSPPVPTPVPATPPAPAPPAPASAVVPIAADGSQILPFDNLRRRTAEHMVRSKATSPHVLTAVEVDFERVARARAAHQAAWRAREGFPLTFLPFVARTVCDALGEFPNLNASVSGENLLVHPTVNLGIAVDIDRQGLIAPVIRGAEGKRLRQLAREIRDLADRARSRRLVPDEVAGGTFTITNPGPFGTFISAPIISQPQVGILSTDGVRKRPVVVEGPEGDSIAIHHVGLLAMSWDHRAFDGAYASAFLARLREIVETRDWEAELA